MTDSVGSMTARQGLLRPKRLGRGLSALLGDESESVPGSVPGQGPKKVPIECLQPGRFQPRRHFGTKVYETVIPRNVRLSESPSHGLPVILYDPSCRGAKSYMELAQELIRKEPTESMDPGTGIGSTMGVEVIAAMEASPSVGKKEGTEG